MIIGLARQANGRARGYNVYKNQHLELLVKRERYPATQAILLPVVVVTAKRVETMRNAGIMDPQAMDGDVGVIR